MADSEEPTPTPTRRRDTQRRRRQIEKRILTATAVTVVVVLAALWFSDTLRIPTDGPTFAGGVETAKPETPAPDEDPVVPEHRALNPLQPLRLWIGGDSLAGALGPSLGQMTAETGVVQPQYDSRVGSGLLDGVGEIDWPEHAQEAMDELDPEVVVFIIGTNDANVYNESQLAEYTALTDKMMRILVGDGREVYWVNAPVMRDEDLEENILKVDEIQRAVAAKIPQVTFVDAHTLFADEAGEYLSSLPDETGDKVQMRAGDGIHFTGAGGDHLAREIFRQLDQKWRINAQAVPGQAKDVLVTEGSTQVDGYDGSYDSDSDGSGSSDGSYDSDGSSNGSSDSESSGTTTTTTATIVTTPPPPPPPPSSVATTTTTAAAPTTPAALGSGSGP